jgi:NAD-dependent SIR2 family protein deacetylase
VIPVNQIPLDILEQAAAAIESADAIIIGAGAGMGVDSGLPDFRGDAGFWKAYPRYAELGLNFADLANPRWFDEDPALAWGFYGHRLHLYRDTRPHAGFAILHKWAQKKPAGAFVFTSNVDGQFQRAGFSAERVLEIHGSIHLMQCTRHCGLGLISADDFSLQLDDATLRAREPLPRCPRCPGILRPNILMFGDGGWDGQRSDAQHDRLSAHLLALRKKQARLCIIECGAGVAIPSVRGFCADLARRTSALLIRINPREAHADCGGYLHLAIAAGAGAALSAIDAHIASRGP